MTQKTTIKGWVAVDTAMGRRRVTFFPNKPVRAMLKAFHYWATTRPDYESIQLGSNLFKGIRWEDEPVEAEIIKNKDKRRRGMIIDEVINGILTDDDVKVLKHLQSIDNLFKKGNLNISELFADNGHMKVTTMLDGKEYEIADFHHITCDGGDPNRYGPDGIHSYNELVDKLDEGGEE